MTTCWLNVKNNATSILTSTMTAGSTSFTVTTGQGALFPSTNFTVTIDSEIILVSSRSSDTFTVGSRAYESTTAAAHAIGAAVNLNLTAAIITELQNEIRGSFSELTISGGSVTITGTRHTIDTQDDAASDELDTISGGVEGMIIALRAANDARTVVVKHNTGNIWLQGKADINLDDLEDGLLLVYDGTKWFDTAAGGGVALDDTPVDGETAKGITSNWAYDHGIATTGVHGAGSNTIAHTGLIREKLSANRTYYVRTDGSDSNTGLVNDASGAFLTIQKAINTAAALDCSIYNITIQLGAGTYVVTSAIVLKSIIGSGSVTIIGDETTPTNVVIDGQGAFPIIYCNAVPYTVYYLKGFKIYSSTANATRAIQSTSNSFVNFQNINFGTGITQYHLSAEYGGVIYATGNYTISGGTYAHVSCNNGTISIAGVTVTITGTPAFSGAYAFAQNCGVAILHACTFSGSATGTRYNISMNGVCYVAGAGATYLPGAVAGTTATGGQYN